MAPIGPDETADARLGLLAELVAMPTSQTLTQIEQVGFPLDTGYVESTIKELEETSREDYAYITSRPYAPGGEPSLAPTSKWFKEWVDGAVEAGDLRVAALTPNGAPQWNKAVLSRQARKGSGIAQTLLDWRQKTKRLEYLRSWLYLKAPDDRIHTTYHAGRVITGRLSSSEPNVQQITGALKPAFVAPEGWFVVDYDYSQIELRVAAEIAQCAPMIAAFLRGDDLHKVLAGDITSKPIDEVTGAERQAGKSANFGLLYGMGAEGFQVYAEDVYGVEFTLEEAEAVREAFFTTWDGMDDWHTRMIRRAEIDGYVTSPLGRIRRLPDIHSSNPYLSSRAERQAINSPVQSTASDIMQTASASIAGNLPGVPAVEHTVLVATVHDSIVALVREDGWQRTVAQTMRRMINALDHLRPLGVDFQVPLAVEATVGRRWGETLYEIVSQ